MAEVLFRAKLSRDDASQPWGFRLQGGVEYGKPLTLLKVNAGSVAARGGLQAGDVVVKLSGGSADAMTHKDAQHAILNAGNEIEILVARGEDDQSLSPSSSSDEEDLEDVIYADLAPPSAPQTNVTLKQVALSDSLKAPVPVEPEDSSRSDSTSKDDKETVSERPSPVSQDTPTDTQPQSVPLKPTDIPRTESDTSTAHIDAKISVEQNNSTSSQTQVMTVTPVEHNIVMTALPDTTEAPSDQPTVPWRKSRRSSQEAKEKSDSPQLQNSDTKSSVIKTVIKEELGISKHSVDNNRKSEQREEKDLKDSENKEQNHREEKTVPWRVAKQNAQEPTINGSNSTNTRSSNNSSIPSEISPPWLQNSSTESPKSSHARSISLPIHHISNKESPNSDKSRKGTVAEQQIETSSVPVESAVDKLKPSLTFVGKRIESPTSSSPVAKSGSFFTVDVTQSNGDKLVQNTTVSSGKLHISTTKPSAYIPPPPGAGPQPLPIPEAVDLHHFELTKDGDTAVIDPELVGLSMPAVKEMVNDLNRRLEAIAVQHPKIVEKDDVGTVFVKKNESEEIFIDSAPNTDLLHPKVISSPSALSPNSASRRVHFAEPVESSVIEIEPNTGQGRRRITRPSEVVDTTTTPVYSSPKSLAATLDRIERENALSSIQFRNSVSTSTATPTTTQAQPHRIPVSVVHASPQANTPGVDFKTTPGGFTFSIGKGYHDKKISVSMTPKQGDKPTHLAFQIPSNAMGDKPAKFSYTISSGGGGVPFKISYPQPPSYEESMRTSAQRVQMMSPPPAKPPNVNYVKATSPLPGQAHIPGGSSPLHFGMAQAGLYPHPDPSKPLHIQTVQPVPAEAFAQQVRASPQASPVSPSLTYITPGAAAHIGSSGSADDQLTQSRSFRRLEARFNNTGGSSPVHSSSIQPDPSPVSFRTLSPTPPGATCLSPSHRNPAAVAAAPMRRASAPHTPTIRLSLTTLQAATQRQQGQGNMLSTVAVAQPAATARTYIPHGELPPPPPLPPQAALRGMLPRPPPSPNMPTMSPLPSPAALAAADLYSPNAAATTFDTLPGLFCLFDRDFTDKFLHWQTQRPSGFRQSETAKLVQEMDQEEYGTEHQ